MTEIVIRWIITALGVAIAGTLFPHLISYDDWTAVLIFAAILGLFNAILRPILAFLTCPFFILTLGFFTFILNAVIFWLATLLPAGVHVSGFLGAFVGALIVSIVSFMGSLFVAKRERNRR